MMFLEEQQAIFRSLGFVAARRAQRLLWAQGPKMMAWNDEGLNVFQKASVEGLQGDIKIIQTCCNCSNKNNNRSSNNNSNHH